MGSSAPDNVRRLVDHFGQNHDGYLPGSHNETQFRHEFSVMPADVLGQVYEQFLGKVIKRTDGHRARVKDKPEVRKAGGVYYTPTYIVDYIVKNTVGRLLEGRVVRLSDTLTRSTTVLPTELGLRMAVTWHGDGRHVVCIGGTP